jgi:hypothetical protein
MGMGFLSRYSGTCVVFVFSSRHVADPQSRSAHMEVFADTGPYDRDVIPVVEVRSEAPVDV